MAVKKVPTKKTPVKRRSPVRVVTQKESSAGFHFYNLHQCCQRKFYIKYICRLTPMFVAPPLVQGSAFHEAKEVYYKTGVTKKAVDVAVAFIKKNQSTLEFKEDYDKILYRVPILILRWIERFGEYDRKIYKFVAIERHFKVVLPHVDGVPDITVTIKPDAIVQEKGSKDIYIMETKTSGFQIETTNMGVQTGDQATSYIYAVQKNLKKEVRGVIPDIAYWNKNAKSEDNIQIVRGDIVIRKDRDLEVWEKSVRQEFLEISQKVEALKKGYDEDALFRRNTFYCMSYGKPCEFANICRMPLKPGMDLPYGFARYAHKKGENLGTHTLDNTIGIS